MKRALSLILTILLLPVFAQAADCRVELVNSDKGSFLVSYDSPDGAYIKTDQSFTIASGTVLFIEIKMKDRNYTLDYISANGERISDFPYYTVVGDTRLEAHFVERTMCNVSLKPVKNGTVTMEYIDTYDMATYAWEEGKPIPSNSMLFVKATPDTDYALDCVMYNGVKGKNNYTVTEDVEVEVIFKPTRVFFDYRVENNFDSSKGNVVIKDAEGTIYNTDDMVMETTVLTVTVTPNDGYKVASFKITGDDFTQEIINKGFVSFNVTRDVLVDTEFTGESGIEDTKIEKSYIYDGNLLYFPDNAKRLFEVYDISGNIKNISRAEVLDLSSYPSGVYLVRVTSDGYNNVIKIIKE